MHVPRARFAFLIEEVQHCLGPLLFVETTRGVFVVRHHAREIVAARQGRFNHRPRLKLQSHATFTIYVSDSSDEVPELLSVHALQQQQQRLFLIERP
jgi:hypothetical protein